MDKLSELKPPDGTNWSDVIDFIKSQGSYQL